MGCCQAWGRLQKWLRCVGLEPAVVLLRVAFCSHSSLGVEPLLRTRGWGGGVDRPSSPQQPPQALTSGEPTPAPCRPLLSQEFDIITATGLVHYTQWLAFTWSPQIPSCSELPEAWLSFMLAKSEADAQLLMCLSWIHFFQGLALLV